MTNHPRFRVKYVVLFINWLGWLFSFLDRMVMTLALPFIGKELHLTAKAQGAILSAFFAGYALSQIPGGMLADKFGSRRVMAIAVAWWSIFTTVTGFVVSYPILLVCRCIFGLGEGCYPGASWKNLVEYFPRRQRATAAAVKSSVNTIGPAISSLVAAAMIAAYGWRHVFMLLGIPGILIAIIIWIYCKDNPAEHPHISQEELAELERPPVAAVTTSTATDTGITFKRFLRKPILWQLLSIWFLFDITFWGFVSWLPSYLMKVRKFSLLQTGISGSIPFFVGIVGMLVGGYLSDHMKGQRKWLYIPNALTAGVFLYLTFRVESAQMAVVYQSISAFFLLMCLAVFWGIVLDSVPIHITGSSSGTVNFGGQAAGAISPFLMGYLIDLYKGSFDAAFVLLIISIAASSAVALTLQQKRAVQVATESAS
jgi:sugar phosphate permease